jgi:hypothetical protein
MAGPVAHGVDGGTTRGCRMTDRGDRESSATVDHVGGDSWSPDRWWRRRSILLAAGFVALWVISIASGISGVFDWDKETLYAVALHDGGMTGAPYLWALPEWAKDTLRYSTHGCCWPILRPLRCHPCAAYFSSSIQCVPYVCYRCCTELRGWSSPSYWRGA